MIMNTETDISDLAHAASLREEDPTTNGVTHAASLQQENAETNDSRESDLEAPIVAVLRTCFDPEIPVDIYELGLIYGIDIEPSGDVRIRMTLTSPGCPVAGSLPGEVEEKVRSVPGVTAAKVELVWEPPWCMDNMSEAAKLQLGMF
jgi:FeS assembly SUF system protein